MSLSSQMPQDVDWYATTDIVFSRINSSVWHLFVSQWWITYIKCQLSAFLYLFQWNMLYKCFFNFRQILLNFLIDLSARLLPLFFFPCAWHPSKLQLIIAENWEQNVSTELRKIQKMATINYNQYSLNIINNLLKCF